MSNDRLSPQSLLPNEALVENGPSRRRSPAAENAPQSTLDLLILANVRDSVIVTDLDGIVTYWNDGATRLFGWTAEEVIGHPLSTRFPEPTDTFIAEQITRLACGAVWNGEYEDYRKDGSRIWIDARVQRFTDADGTPIGILGISHDITDRKRAEEALHRQERQFRTLVEHSPDIIARFDRTCRHLYVSPG